MALIGRERTCEGAYIDCAMFDSLLPWCVHTAGSAIAGGAPPRSASQRSLGGAAFYQVYRTADGAHVVLGGRELKFARNLLTALAREDLIPLAEAPAGEQGELIGFLRERMAHFMVPRYVRVMDDLPKTPTQKVQKHLIRSAGVTTDTWDREAAGVVVRRDRLSG